MIIAALVRPHITSGEVIFDGKIGIFPFTKMVPAKRWSKNKDAGIIETKPNQQCDKRGHQG